MGGMGADGRAAWGQMGGIALIPRPRWILLDPQVLLDLIPPSWIPRALTASQWDLLHPRLTPLLHPTTPGTHQTPNGIGSDPTTDLCGEQSDEAGKIGKQEGIGDRESCR